MYNTYKNTHTYQFTGAYTYRVAERFCLQTKVVVYKLSFFPIRNVVAGEIHGFEKLSYIVNKRIICVVFHNAQRSLL